MSSARPSVRRALFPGTFDPPTRGHLALIRRGLGLFDEVLVGVAVHPTKQALFPAEERQILLQRCVEGLPRVRVLRIEGLVIEACLKWDCQALLRGVRSGTDFDYEVTLARNNRVLSPAIDTVLLVPDSEVAHVTATIVREVAALGGDVSQFVPAPVAAALAKRFSPQVP
jgi:pantetheine-phosphate adenylyltransferase